MDKKNERHNKTMYVVIDTETTGIDSVPQQVIEVAARYGTIVGGVWEDVHAPYRTYVRYTTKPSKWVLESEMYQGVLENESNAVEPSEAIESLSKPLISDRNSRWYFTGANPSFDRDLLEKAGLDRSLYSFRLIDVEILAMQELGTECPIGLSETYKMMFPERTIKKRHTAPGDVDATVEIMVELAIRKQKRTTQ